MATLLKVENLKAAYGGIHALRGVSIEVEEGEIVSVLGANGAGKSTLLKCISAVMKRTEGTIEFEGKYMRHDIGQRALAAMEVQ